MGRIVVTENAALDGMIEQVGDWFAPAGDSAADDSDAVTTLREHMDRQAALLLGRKTFEAFRGYWPAQTEDTTGIRARLNQVSSVVGQPVFFTRGEGGGECLVVSGKW